MPDEDVAIIDIQAAVGHEDVVDAVASELCRRATRCVQHIGKSIRPQAGRHAFESYYAGVATTSPARCYHPFCARDGAMREYRSVRGPTSPYTLW